MGRERTDRKIDSHINEGRESVCVCVCLTQTGSRQRDTQIDKLNERDDFRQRQTERQKEAERLTETETELKVWPLRCVQ